MSLHLTDAKKIEKLRQSLEDLEFFFRRPGEDANDAFERIGEAFYKETRMLRPGKSEPLGCETPDEVRNAKYEEWVQGRLARARRLLKPYP